MIEPVLPDGILTLDRDSGVALSEQIYRGIRDAVRSGHLQAGTRLPSSRRLAAGLSVGRNTVNTAYELLQTEGIIRSRSGAVPVVMEELRLETAIDAASGTRARPELSSRGALMAADMRGPGWGGRHSDGALQPGAPALDTFPFDDWARVLRRAARSVRSHNLQYRNYTGLPALKAELARHLLLERGVQADPEQILITASMQAILTLLAQGLADPGDTVWIEEPGYIGARTAFHGAGLKMVPLPTDGEGADPAAVPPGTKTPKMIYVTPSHNYPLGMRMPLARRLALIEAARVSGAIILEDDYDSEFLFVGRPVAALHGLAEAERIVYMGTFAKSLMPGLRIAFCVLPTSLIESMSQMVRNFGCAANVQTQAALAQFIDSGLYQKHLKHIRQIYEERGRYLVGTLRKRLGNQIDVDMPTGNVQVTAKFQDTVDDVALAKAMQARGFSVSPLSNCYIGGGRRSGLIIGFADATQDQVAAGVAALSVCLDDARSGSNRLG
ncbi:PLP-dependent aminotransferase family protein [Roseibium denhamense]|uniref:GntR family transcriptional regulator / MocR family aminotransferase n=1 Tax=Roseibium denhamense TaxID=76305 RepID=A0ABY1NB53_9HYPH|nr:PLP-dependent aminotransferase family protein [Roseibium denhamense]MTI06580.1 PLP-dependent aminotransferase family protein [Roseibium denhamense]SMP05385.1 GntR family transcriptional regulator / MocR family aminotransferase [Roseibium denhamense]